MATLSVDVRESPSPRAVRLRRRCASLLARPLPEIRTTFVVSFVPAAIVIGLFPLAPPHWLPGARARRAAVGCRADGTTGALFHNTTAAAASQHFGFAAFVAATSIWLFPRSRLAWPTSRTRSLVFVVIVGTGNHYVLDCIVGALTFVFAAAVAAVVQGHAARCLRVSRRAVSQASRSDTR